MRTSIPVVRRGPVVPGLLALLASLAGCGNSPFEPGSEWLIGTWRFEAGGCWPDIEITPDSLGYALAVRLLPGGRAEVRHDGVVVDQPRFTARTHSGDADGTFLVLEFEHEIIRVRRSFRIQRDSAASIWLQDYGATDGCGFHFVRLFE